MRHARRAAAWLASGMLVGFAAALLRPRSRYDVGEVAPDDHRDDDVPTPADPAEAATSAPGAIRR